MSWFSDHPLPLSPAPDRIRLQAGASLLAHALIIAMILWQPRLPGLPGEVEIPATIELQIGGGAQRTGAAQTAPPQQPAEAVAAQRPTEPVQPPPPVTESEPSRPKVADTAQPDSRPPSPQQTATALPLPTPEPGNGLAGPRATIEKGGGVTAAASAAPGNVAPDYPAESELRQERGRVVLAVHIDARGLVTQVDILRSSGSPRLDAAARDTLMRWRYHPALRNGQAVPSVLQQGVAFGL